MPDLTTDPLPRDVFAAGHERPVVRPTPPDHWRMKSGHGADADRVNLAK
jgi:hypothetical protein